MKKIILYFVLCFVFLVQLKSQHYNVFGYVTSRSTEERLFYATCFDSTHNIGVVANDEGFYSMALPQGKIKLVTSYVGYKPEVTQIILKKDTNINIQLSSLEIESVIVVAKEQPLHRQTLMGKISISPKSIQYLPSVFGETDVLKSITILPGVGGGKEGFSHLHVRGGEHGHNLILLDNVPIYNTNHLGGLVSLFNSNVIKDIDLYKGGFPARYGGRLSSVLDIKMKEGDYNAFHGKFNLGVLQSDVFLEGPIKKGQTSFLFAARSTYFDLINIKEIRKYRQNDFGELYTYTFFDINGKINHKLNKRNHVYLQLYTGHDINSLIEKSADTIPSSPTKKIKHFTYNYKLHNTAITAGYRNIVSSKLFFNSHFTFSSYSNSTLEESKIFMFENNEKSGDSRFSKINSFTVKSILDFAANNQHSFKTGLTGALYQIQPHYATSYIEEEASQTRFDTVIGNINPVNAHELAFFLEDEMKLTEKANINAGLRTTFFNGNNCRFFNAEPRISFRWLFSPNYSFKMNYTTMNQYFHVLLNNYDMFEREIWVASTSKIPPSRSRQVSSGVFGYLYNLGLEFGLEAFYKTMYDLLYHQAQEISMNDWENGISADGIGKSYGMELLLKKETDKLKSTLAYTLAWNNREFPNLNFGKPFPYDYDKRHDIALTMQYIFDETYTLGTNFVFHSGLPITLMDGYVGGNKYFHNYYMYSGINNMHMPPYHRLDLLYKKQWISKKHDWKQHFTINIYNVYARQNPVIIYYIGNKLKQKSLFSIIPTISYGFEF